MKRLFLIIVMLSLVVVPFTVMAGDYGYERRPYKDYWGNSYKSYDNMWKDKDRDGVPNYYDYNDRNPNVQTPYQRDYYDHRYRRY